MRFARIPYRRINKTIYQSELSNHLLYARLVLYLIINLKTLGLNPHVQPMDDDMAMTYNIIPIGK